MPIQHPSLYDAVYARMQSIRTNLSVGTWKGKNRVYRTAPTKYAGRIGADEYRKPWNSSAKDNRWTGPRPAPVTSSNPAASGVYTSVGISDALLGELTFYDPLLRANYCEALGLRPGTELSPTLDEDVARELADKKPKQRSLLTPQNFPAALAARRIFEYEFPIALPIADLSLTSGRGRELLRNVSADACVRAELRKAGYRDATQAYLANFDNSLPRALSQAIRDLRPEVSAIWVTSARADEARAARDIEGDNIVFYGTDSTPIQALKPIQEISFVPQPDGKLKELHGYFKL